MCIRDRCYPVSVLTVLLVPNKVLPLLSTALIPYPDIQINLDGIALINI